MQGMTAFISHHQQVQKRAAWPEGNTGVALNTGSMERRDQDRRASGKQRDVLTT